MKPERFQPTLFGFLVRGADGKMPRDASQDAVILPLPGRAGRSMPGTAAGPQPSLTAPKGSRSVAPRPPAQRPLSELAQEEMGKRPLRRTILRINQRKNPPLTSARLGGALNLKKPGSWRSNPPLGRNWYRTRRKNPSRVLRSLQESGPSGWSCPDPRPIRIFTGSFQPSAQNRPPILSG